MQLYFDTVRIKGKALFSQKLRPYGTAAILIKVSTARAYDAFSW